MRVSGCIVTYNNSDTIERCISSVLEATKGLDFTLYISDNASTDNTVEFIRTRFPKDKYPMINIILNEKNGGFGYGHNIGLKQVHSDVHFIINPDIYVDEPSDGESSVFEDLANYLMDHEDTALITPKVMNVGGGEQFLPKVEPTVRRVILSKFPGFKKYRKEYTRELDEFTEPTSVEFCTGCFFGARTKTIKEFKGFSKRYYMYFEDSDLSKRVLQSGMKIVFFPNNYVYHDWNRDNMKSLKGIFRFLSSMTKYFNKWGWKF